MRRKAKDTHLQPWADLSLYDDVSVSKQVPNDRRGFDRLGCKHHVAPRSLNNNGRWLERRSKSASPLTL